MSNKMLFLKKLHLKRMQACWCLKSREILFWTSSTKYYKVINLYNFFKKKKKTFWKQVHLTLGIWVGMVPEC